MHVKNEILIQDQHCIAQVESQSAVTGMRGIQVKMSVKIKSKCLEIFIKLISDEDTSV